MKYKEFEGLIGQQGTQSGVNMLNSAILEVEVTDISAPTAVKTGLAACFEVSTDAALAAKLIEISMEKSLPVIKIVASTATTRKATIIRDIEVDSSAKTVSMYWTAANVAKTLTITG